MAATSCRGNIIGHPFPAAGNRWLRACHVPSIRTFVRVCRRRPLHFSSWPVPVARQESVSGASGAPKASPAPYGSVPVRLLDRSSELLFPYGEVVAQGVARLPRSLSWNRLPNPRIWHLRSDARMKPVRRFSFSMIASESETSPIPTATGIYTIPEISMVGKTEAQLTREGICYEVGVANYREVCTVLLGGTSSIL